VFGSTLRVIVGVLFTVLVSVATLAFAKGYVHARRAVTPIIVTPNVTWEEVDHPRLGVILERMKQLALEKLGWASDPRPPLVALTFDDGPYATLTPQLLDLLKRHHIHATFFIEGKDGQMQPELVRRIAREGHELGNHSFTHASFVGLDEAGITRELVQTDRLIRRLTGIATPIMRPPGGRLDASRYRLVHRLGYTVVNDNDNPGDYRESNPERLYTFTMMHSSRCAIICMHSGRLITIKTLPTIIEAYRKKGYRFATVAELAKAQGMEIPPLTAESAAPRTER
jgi:peptidoglycan/xylan/chitin deacetylase (PgdA/CDA1 family)